MTHFIKASLMTLLMLMLMLLMLFIYLPALFVADILLSGATFAGAAARTRQKSADLVKEACVFIASLWS